MVEINRITQIRKKCIVTMLLTFSTFWLSHSLALAGRGSLTTTLKSYIIDEPVVFTFSVQSGPSVLLPTDAPYEIRKDGRLVFGPKRSPKVRRVETGNPAKWIWNQRDVGERSVSTGTYNIILFTKNDGRHETSFKIVSEGRSPLKERCRIISWGAFGLAPLLSTAAMVAVMAPPAVAILPFTEIVVWGLGVTSYALAEDPPDTNYREPVALKSTHITLPPPSSDLDTAAQTFISSGLRVFDLQNALRQSIERMDGAREAKAEDFIAQHHKGIMDFSKDLLSAIETLRANASNLANELKRAGIVQVTQESVKKYFDRGFSPEEIQAFRQIGFNDYDRALLRSILEKQIKGGNLLESLHQLSNNLELLDNPLIILRDKGE